MTDHTQALLHDALALPVDERAELVHDLLPSLEPASTDDADQIADAWRRELDRRGREVQNGDVTGVEWSTVRERLRGELADG